MNTQKEIDESVKLWQHTNLISPTCSICGTVYQTKAYGGNLEYCPRCEVIGANYLKEIEIARLAYEAKVDNIKQRWQRKVIPECVVQNDEVLV